MATVPKMLATALHHHQAGRLPEAEALYRKILQAHPNHPDALHLLGVIAHQAGKHDVAVDYIGRAIGFNPKIAEYHNNIGEAYRAQGKLEEAVACYGRALALRPAYAEPHSGLGMAFHAQGRLEEAMTHYRRALAIRPRYAEVHNNLGVAFKALGRREESVACFRQALALKPAFAEAYNNLGTAFEEQGQADDAISHFQRALSLKPHYTDAQCNLASALQGKGCTREALQVLFGGLASRPTNAQLRRTLAETLRGVTLGTAGEKERAILLDLCNDDNITTRHLDTAIIGLLKSADAFPLLQKDAQDGGDPYASGSPAVEAFMRDPLLLSALPRMTIFDADLERVLAHMRRRLLLRSGTTPGPAAGEPGIPFEFLCALSRQCFYSGYAFFSEDDEARQVEAVREAAQAALRRPVTNFRALEWPLAVLALYDSLNHVNGCERLLEPPMSGWSEAFRPIVQEQLVNRRREQEIAEHLTAITSIKDEVSLAVRRQYEESPYPLWVSVHHPKPVTIEALALRCCPSRGFRLRPRPVPMLIAGCGTGHHPIEVARTYPESEILAVDLSLTSLAYAARMAERFGISNITFRQADILELGKLDRRFAVIECGGVLHHLKDPMAGWQVLAGLLEPDGLMKIGLYSEKARSSIRAAREFIQPLDLPLTPEGIRRCRHAVMNLPDGHPARSALTFGDFFTLNGCRDLIMHVQEHNFTLPGIADCLEQLGLRFCGLQCEPHIQDRFRAMFPESSALFDLEAWNRFEEACPQTFKGMYNFWCCRKSEA